MKEKKGTLINALIIVLGLLPLGKHENLNGHKIVNNKHDFKKAMNKFEKEIPFWMKMVKRDTLFPKLRTLQLF